MSLRILHLLDPAAGEDPILACSLALRTPGFDHHVWAIGARAAARRAAAAGVTPHRTLAAPAQRPTLAWPAARAMAADLRRAGAAPDVVHCWSFSTLTLARLAFGPRLPKVVFASSGPAATPRWSRPQLADGPLVVTTARGIWRRWIADVSLDARLLPLPLHTATPADRRADLRAHLGIDAAAPRPALVIALLADPPTAADARAFAFMLGLLHLAGGGDTRVIGVVPRGVGQGRRGARFVRAHGRRWGLVEWDGPMSALAPAADLAMWSPPTDSGLLTAAYAAAGVPTVVHDPDAAAALTARGAEVLVSLGPSVPQIAAALLPRAQHLAADPRPPVPLVPHADPSPSAAEYRALLADLWADAARRWIPGAAPTGAVAR